MPISSQAAPRNFRIPKVTVATRLRVETPVADTGDMLLIAPKLASGAGGITGRIYTVGSENEASRIFGSGSIGHRMYRAWSDQAPFNAIRMMVLDNAGTARVDNLTFSGTTTGAGTLLVHIGNDTIQADVESGDSASDVATAVAAAITAYTNPLQFTAAVDGTVDEQVNVTARNGGAVNNSVGIEVDLNGVPGITAVDATATPGSGNYDYSTVENCGC